MELTLLPEIETAVYQAVGACGRVDESWEDDACNGKGEDGEVDHFCFLLVLLNRMEGLDWGQEFVCGQVGSSICLQRNLLTLYKLCLG